MCWLSLYLQINRPKKVSIVSNQMGLHEYHNPLQWSWSDILPNKMCLTDSDLQFYKIKCIWHEVVVHINLSVRFKLHRNLMSFASEFHGLFSNKLDCYSCDTPCSITCPPCNKACMLRCRHNKCQKRCGQRCTPCQVRH